MTEPLTDERQQLTKYIIERFDRLTLDAICLEANEKMNAQAKEIARLREGIAAVKGLVDKQATDEGLWFIAQTAPEAYLQQELRKLHGAVEIMAMDDRT